MAAVRISELRNRYPRCMEFSLYGARPTSVESRSYHSRLLALKRLVNTDHASRGESGRLETLVGVCSGFESFFPNSRSPLGRRQFGSDHQRLATSHSATRIGPAGGCA